MKLTKTQKEQAKAIALMAGSNTELVKSGVANKVAQMLEIEIDTNVKNETKNEGGNTDE